MPMERVLTVSTLDNDEKAIDRTRHLTGEERLSLLEDLRRDMFRMLNREYPQRVQRVLEIVTGAEV